MYARLRAWLASPHAHRWVLGLALALSALSLDTGLGADDHIHALILRGSERIEGLRRPTLDLFRFATGDPETNRRLMRDGVFPWWADPGVKLSFWRPLSSAGHYLDYVLWPTQQWLMHLHSVLWYALSLWGVWALYRRLMPQAWIAVLALLLYAVDDARGAPVAWIANRHALVGAALAIWAPVAHVRWRSEGWRPGRWLGPSALLVGLFASESAVGVLAYLLAFAVWMDRGSWRARAASLAPYAAVIIGWRVVYRALGYGVHGSGLYVDPLRSPLAFAMAVMERGPPLLLSQLALPWSEWWTGYGLVAWWLPWLVWSVAVLVIGVTVWLLSGLLRREPRMRFWCTGALLASIPVCTTFPSDRMLVLVAVGAMAAIAELFAWICASISRFHGAAARGWRGLAHAIIATHLVLAVALFPLRARGIIAVREALARANDSLPKEPQVSDQVFVLVNPPSDPFASYVPIMRAALGEPMPKTQAWLTAGTSPVRIERVDERTLRVTPEAGYLQNGPEWMLRSPVRPMAVGDTVALDKLSIEVVRLTEDGRPAETLVRFDEPLEDPELRWFRWEGYGYVPFEPPPVGESVRLDAVDLIAASLGPSE